MDSVIEPKYGGGYRTPGVYLVGSFPEVCRLFPLPFYELPSDGLRWLWIDHKSLEGIRPCDGTEAQCAACPMRVAGEYGGRFGLMWVRTYRAPFHFLAEARRYGRVWRKIRNIPSGYELGVTRILLAHRSACGENQPGVFGIWQPDKVEIVCVNREPSAKEKALAERYGERASLMHVIPDTKSQLDLLFE